MKPKEYNCMPSAVILLSGGLDSTVMLAMALANGKTCFPLSLSYGQKHLIELEAAEKIADYYQLKFQKIAISLPWKSLSSLTSSLEVPNDRAIGDIARSGVPSTYVPGRNTLFLSYAAGFAKIVQADEIHLGCNRLDIPNYPDCRPEFIDAFQKLLDITDPSAPRIIAPLHNYDKQDIVKIGRLLQAPLEKTWSCYDPQNSNPCKRCDACVLRNHALVLC
jgi:7-cyano-7-deazaguanine synthase